MADSIIVKVQLSLGVGESQTLVYDKARTVFFQAPTAPEVAALMGDAKRAYFKADVDAHGAVTLLDRVEDQPW